MTGTSRRRMGGQHRVCIGLAAAAVALGISACGSASHDAGGSASGGSRPTTSSGTPSKVDHAGSSKDNAPSGKATKLPKGATSARAKDPLAAKSATAARRGPGTSRSVKVTGGTKAFNRPAVFTDGLKLTISSVRQTKTSGQGPGVFPGRPLSDFSVTLRNGTSRPLVLGVVVVTVTYGSPARVAQPVYDRNSVDFTGTIPVHGSAKAVYGFSIPTASLNDVRMTVDLDGKHQVATFTGAVK